MASPMRKEGMSEGSMRMATSWSPASRKAVAALPEDAFNRKVMGDPEVAKRIQFQAPITDAQREQYLQLWQELKVNVK